MISVHRSSEKELPVLHKYHDRLSSRELCKVYATEHEDGPAMVMWKAANGAMIILERQQ